MAKNEIAKSDKTMFPDMLKKSNFLISSVYRASLLENKVLALALTKVRLSDQGRPVATLRTKEIKEVLHVTGNAMGTYLKDVATSLAGRTMFIESADGSFKCMSLVGVVSYESGSGTMEIKFEPEIKDYIYDLKANFTMLNIPMMLSFRSGWSYRLYELLSSREPNLANSLSGKVSGLQIVRSSNGVGGSSKIVLRGNNSLTGSNQPLIVVDGTPMDNFTGGVDDVWGNSGADMGNGLSDINPEDIESMTVLKGASAAALYGSRAGNGVILITTKSGKKNEGSFQR